MIPHARSVQKFVYDNYGKNLFGYLVLIIVVLCLIGGILYLTRNTARGVSVRNYLWLVGVAGVYGYVTLKLWKHPEEAIHFLEYGLLSFLFHRALRHHVHDVTIYFTASFIVLFVGTIDEIIQFIIPSRVGDFRDVWLNFLGGALLQIGLWKGIRPESISGTIRLGSVRILSVTVVCCLILLGLCASMSILALPVFLKG